MNANALGDLGKVMMDHICRFRLGITRFCCASLKPYFPALSERETKQKIKILWREQGLLRRETLFGNRQCYQVSQSYLQQYVPVPGHRRQRLSERDRIMAWAMLKLCCGSDPHQRKKLLKEELDTCFPDIQIDQQRSENYYLHEGRIGYLRVDLGGRGRWDRVAAYCARDLSRHEAQRPFASLMREGYFEMTVVTCTPQKARRLTQLLARRPIHDVVAIDVVAFPELLNWVSPPPTQLTSIPRRGF